MILALAAFVRLWCMTHPRPPPAPEREGAVELKMTPPPDGVGPADSGVAH
jgi:hypothetical protein